MTSGNYCFDRFVLDVPNRLLLADAVPVELSGRYLDALALMVREAGGLVSKERFLDEVWRGVPVTDEALTQCIKTLRRVLGDDAARPRFIETVPKHGYRFVAQVQRSDDVYVVEPPDVPAWQFRKIITLASAGVVGGGLAGLTGGLFYGFVGANQPLANGAGGAASLVLVLTSLSILIALIGAAGVSIGIAVAMVSRRGVQWIIGGGALGGLAVGGIVKILGLDAFNLLFGKAPTNITGALEGTVIGAAVGTGLWLGRNAPTLLGSVWPAAVVGGSAGLIVTATGGKLMGGSLDLLAQLFPQSQLRLDPIGGLFGEAGFGSVSQIVTGGLEGALFAAFIAGAMLLAKRQSSP